MQFVMVPHWLLDRNLSSVALHVYLVLGTFGTWSERNAQYLGIRPSVSTLAETARVSESTVQRALRELIKVGAVVRTFRFGPDGRQLTSAYRCVLGTLVPPPDGPAPDEVETVDAPAADTADSGGECHQWYGGGMTGDTPGGVTSGTGGASLVTPNQEPIEQEPEEQEERTLTRSLGTADPAGNVTAPGDITRGFIDYCREERGITLPPTAIKRFAAKIKELREGGIPDLVIRRALVAQLDDNAISRPALLDHYATRVQTGPERRPRVLTTTEASIDRMLATDQAAVDLLRSTLARNNPDQLEITP